MTWEWLLDFYHLKNKSKPNRGHTALHSILKEVVSSDRQGMLVTQNIEDFHVEVKTEKQKKKSNEKEDYMIC
jgi:NAD-dependent SIR2 family protein deacetylase